MSTKRLAFGLLFFVSCLMACFIIYLLVMLSLLWADYRFEPYIFASVIAINIIGLIMLWRVTNKAYYRLWKVPKVKVKNDDFSRLEIAETENEDFYSEDKQSKRKSNP